MGRAVLIDMDNTMVLYDEPAYYERYFHRIVPWFSDLVEPSTFRPRLLAAVAHLRESGGRALNRDRFLDRFCRDGKLEKEAVWKRFGRFYEIAYPGIPVRAARPPGLRRVLDRLKAAGLKRVVATNPVFPESAVRQRLSWVGIELAGFDFATHIENMSYVKPSPGYYLEICDRIGERPEDCLMVGNDPSSDLAAGRAGLRTYLATDALRAGVGSVVLTGGGGAEEGLEPDFTGPFSSVGAAAGVS
jgi:FMN phosphatase YigB (HAD superfamily)